jgi:CRP-like cAMP-binding protein
MARTPRLAADASHAPEQNHLLAAFSPDERERIYPYLRLVELPLGKSLYEPGRVQRHVYFPTDSIVSLLYVLENGASAEISVVGNEGLLGITLFMGGESTLSRSLVQSAGYAYRLPRARVKAEFNRHGQLLLLMLRYTQAMISQLAQTAICNRHHSIFEQLCRWLLLTLDRLSQNQVTMTQEFISNMLGVRREGVTAAATRLRDLGIISYGRGVINVLDRAALEQVACECYESVRSETEKILRYVPQRRVVLEAPVPVVEIPKSPEGAPRGSIARSVQD